MAGGMFTAFERGRQDGCEAMQIFARPSAQWRARPLPPEEVSSFRSEHAAQAATWPLLSHTSYLINLGTEDPLVRGRSLSLFAKN